MQMFKVIAKFSELLNLSCSGQNIPLSHDSHHSALDILQDVYRLNLCSLSFVYPLMCTDKDVDIITQQLGTLSLLSIVSGSLSSAPTLWCLLHIAENCLDLISLSMQLTVTTEIHKQLNIKTHNLWHLTLLATWFPVSLACFLDTVYPKLDKFVGWSQHKPGSELVKNIL